MIFIKILLVLLVAFSLLFLAYSRKLKNINRFVLFGLFVFATYFIVFPADSDIVANYFGIGRGVDLILYITNAILLLLVAILYAKSGAISGKITLIVRNKAIENAKDTSIEQNKVIKTP